jgi:hypothetical protein
LTSHHDIIIITKHYRLLLRLFGDTVVDGVTMVQITKTPSPNAGQVHLLDLRDWHFCALLEAYDVRKIKRVPSHWVASRMDAPRIRKSAKRATTSQDLAPPVLNQIAVLDSLDMILRSACDSALARLRTAT